MSRRTRLAVFVAVIGPGLLAGLSDDDPAGITTYSVLGAKEGNRLLWVLALSTVALVLFHELGARVGIVTGQGLTGLIREAYGVRRAGIALVALVVANVGTTCAEFAGIAAALEIAGVSRYVSVPLAAAGVSYLVLRGTFHRIERVLLAVSGVFVTYVIAGILAHPDWSDALRGATVPSLPSTRDGVAIATATVGTTLAPWGLAFIQSYAADKKLRVDQLRYERIDVALGAVLTGVIGVFIVVACTATLHQQHIDINDAADAARALRPLAGDRAGDLFAVGLAGAALLAASILPLSTAYSVSEFVGRESTLDDQPREAPLFYATYGLVIVAGAGAVLVPGAPLVSILVLTQVLNAVLLLPLLVFMYGISRNEHLMGEFAASRREAAAYVATIALIAASVVALGVVSVTGS
jgi:NRAMP (natural resistance-associated macrophage protein)-like metal ion transporter